MMILDFNSFKINESSLKKLKKEVRGALGMSDRKRMRQELRNNIITFKFRKKNGELRTAHGTLHPSYLPKLKGGSPRPELQMVYYDLDKEGWRSFRAYKFIKITDIEPVDSKIAPKKKPVSVPVKSSKTVKAEEDEEKRVVTKHGDEDSKKEIERKPEKIEKKSTSEKIDDDDDEKNEGDDYKREKDED